MPPIVARPDAAASALEILERTLRPIEIPPTVPRFAGQSGVYLLVDLDEISYVGSSTNAEHRLYSHAITQRTTGLLTFDRALFVALPVKVHPFYEGAFIRALQPKHNYTVPKDRGYDSEILDGFGIGHLTPARDEDIRRKRVIPYESPTAPLIKAAMARAGLNGPELAESLGICRQTVHHWETGRNSPGPARLAQIANALGCLVADLLPESN